ncbi:MAG: hypothetical protein ABIB71_02295 [Candidatus Woesearchaeota archaeon]
MSKDKMQETITEEQKKTAFQLKKLLAPAKKQDLGDKSRWEKIPVEYIMSANTFGIDLNDYALNRLSEAEDKHYALEAIYVAQYFSKEARKKGKEEIAKEVEAMIGNEKISTEDLGLYAMKKMEGTIPKEKKLEKLMNAYHGKTKEKNILDIVIVPTDKGHACASCTKLPKSLDNLIINIYSKDGDISSATETAEELIRKGLDEKIRHYESEIGTFKNVTILTSCMNPVAWGIGVAISLSDPEFSMIAGLATGAATGLICTLIPGATIGGCWYHSSKKLKKEEGKKAKLQEILSNAEINLIKDESLEAAYNAIIQGKEPEVKQFKNASVKNAVIEIVAASRKNNLRNSFTEAYENIVGEVDEKSKKFSCSISSGEKDEKKHKAKEECHGLLFGDSKILKYLSLNEKKVYRVAVNNRGLWAILPTEEDIYYSHDHVESLQGFESGRRNWKSASIIQHKGKILDSGHELVSTLDNKVLISKEQANDRKISFLVSLNTYNDERLYCMVQYNDEAHGFIKIEEDKGEYSLGNEILHYPKEHTYICQAAIIPNVRPINNKHSFCVLSCTNLKYLDINGEMIRGSKISKGTMNRFALMGVSGDMAEVAYSKWDSGRIYKAVIDITRGKIVEKRTLTKKVSNLTSIAAVKSRGLHESIIKKGAEVR